MFDFENNWQKGGVFCQYSDANFNSLILFSANNFNSVRLCNLEDMFQKKYNSLFIRKKCPIA